MSRIALLIPVLNRPARKEPLVESIRTGSAVMPEILFLCSPGDDEEIAACEATGHRTVVVDWPCGDGDYARKINLGVTLTQTEFVFTGADDLEFRFQWDTEALAAMDKGPWGVIGTYDAANPLVMRGRHSTHSLVRRSYIDEIGGTWHDGPGVLLHEGYKHQWVDTELVGAALDRGLWLHVRRSVVEHLHPYFNKQTQMDDTYRKALGDAAHDSALFNQRRNRAHPRRGRLARAL